MINQGPKIVTNGLVLCLDAANTKSYPGSGTSLYDLSGGGNDGTLVSSPTFDSQNGGSFYFNGVNNYIQLDTFSSLFTWPVFTICGWGKRQNTGEVNRIFAITAGTSSPVASIALSDSGPSFWSRGDVNPQILLYGNSIENNKWYYVCGVSAGLSDAKIYVNGEFQDQDLSTTRNSSFTVSRATIGALRRSSTDYNTGNVSCIHVYNRALSASEVAQNFNALKDRFGL